MNGKWILLACFIFFQLFFPQVVFTNEKTSAASPDAETLEKIGNLLQEAESDYQARDMSGRADRAIKTYRRILQIDPLQIEALWKLSRSLQWQGDLEKAKDEKLRLYREAEHHAKTAVSLDESSVSAQLMLGITYGQIAETQGTIQAFFFVSPIKKAMQIVLKAEPENDVAHHVLGVLYRKLPGLLGGSLEKSIAHFNQAIHGNPLRTRHYLELARSLNEANKKTEAIAMLEKLLEIKKTENPPQSLYDRKKAVDLLSKLQPIKSEKK